MRGELGRFRGAYVYGQTDVQAFVDDVLKELGPGARQGDVVLTLIDTALDAFEPGAPERQELLALKYWLSGQRPGNLILPSVAFIDGKPVVHLENVEIYNGSDEPTEPSEPDMPEEPVD